MSSHRKSDLLHTPEGVWDHYGKDYQEYLTTQNRILEQMHRFGYEDIKTPTFEFFDVFSREIGSTPDQELYKFFDKENNTLVLRPDFTPGVARCVAKYYADETAPIRFCYEGSAFANTKGLQGRLHESTQMGAECMNCDCAKVDAEMIALLVLCLQAAGLSDFQVTVGNVEYFRGICDAAGIDGETEEELRDYISGKNFFAAEDLLKSRNVPEEYRQHFLGINDFLKNGQELEKVLSAAPNERSRGAILRLQEVYKVLEMYGAERYVSFDLSLLSRYHYYTGIVFKGYTVGVGDVIATGGRYDRLLEYFGKRAAAVGFMIPVDTLMEALRAQKIRIDTPAAPETVYYTEENFQSVLSDVQKRRAAGERIRLVKAGHDKEA